MTGIRRSIAAATLLLLPALPATAEGDPFSATFRQCMEKADGATQAERQCLFVETADWDHKLNERYAQMLHARSGEERATLQTAQKLWLKFRDANCRVKSQSREGQQAVNAMAYCLMRMTVVRAHELMGME